MEPDLLREAADLFNRKLYFECHDLLEDAWAGTRGEERPFLQGLIQASVGMYHIAAGNYPGAVSQLEQSLDKLEPFPDEHEGVDLKTLSASIERCLAKAREGAQGAPVRWDPDDVPEIRLRGS